MPLPIANLDDWSFRELVDEGLRLLPSFAPAWTNYNPSDPGITLLELLAYFTEQLIFQTGQLTDADLAAFLTLLNGQASPQLPRQSTDDALRASILELRTPSRAVSSLDFELCATQADARVARAKCLERLNLAERSQAARAALRPGHVSVVLVPRSQLDAPSLQSLASAVEAYLEPRRMLTTRVHVVPARYVSFDVCLMIVAAPGIAAAAAAEAATEAIRAFFDPLRGGHTGEGWPFGRAVFISDLYKVVAGLPTTSYAARALDPVTGREVDELQQSEASLDRLTRNRQGELVSLILEPDELPGDIKILISPVIFTIDQSRQV